MGKNRRRKKNTRIIRRKNVKISFENNVKTDFSYFYRIKKTIDGENGKTFENIQQKKEKNSRAFLVSGKDAQFNDEGTFDCSAFPPISTGIDTR